MSAAPDDRGAVTPVVHLAPNESIDLDVDYCDLVPPNRVGEPPAFRFKGRVLAHAEARGHPLLRRGDRVVVYVDATMGEIPMRKSGVLRVDLPDLPAGEKVQPIRLERRQLALRRPQGTRGQTHYEIRPREGAVATADDELVRDFQWALGTARNQLAGTLQADGYAVGADDLVAMATTLFHERRRSRQGRG